MAKKQGDSKLAVAGTITLGLAIAGVMLVQSPLKSTRPPSMGGELKPHVAEGVVAARLWEDPLEAVRRVAKFDGEVRSAAGEIKDDVDRVRAIRQELDDKIGQQPGRPITVLLVTAEGGLSGESRETRIRDRYAIGSALGIACYVPHNENQLSYVEWRDRAGASRVLPYEWYGDGPRTCSLDTTRASSILILWVSSEITGDHPIGTLQRLTQSILCEESAIGRHACQTGRDGTVLLDPRREQHLRFKIIGPRSSSGFRNLLEEAAGTVQGRDDHLIWANAGGRVELYSPWATAMPKLLTQGLNVAAKPAESSECASPDASREQLCWILLKAGIELKHSIGSDDRLFGALTQELERRRVKFERDAVILIAEWDSFYGRVLPVEFTAAVCHRIAHRTDAENRAINKERLARIQSECATVNQAVELQVNSPAGTRGLGLNVWRYSYLRGLDGEVPAGEKGEAAKGNGAKSIKSALFDSQVLERPIGTSQFDYAQRLASRIERDMTEVANAISDDEEDSTKNPVTAIGILGSDAYDALLILQAMRERFPGAVFFTTDLDTRLVYADEYRWTRNLVTASHYGLELYGMLQRDVPPFRSSYQTSAYFATLQAVGHVRPLSVCPPSPAGQSRGIADTPLSPCGYRANLTADHVWFSGVEPPRLFEVGRHGAIDLSVGAVEEGHTLHAPRVDLSDDAPQTTGRRPPSGVIYGSAGLAYVIGFILLWTRPASHRWMTAHTGLLLFGALGAVGLAFFVDRVLLDIVLRNHDQGEPFYWLEGVSLWPTEILRGLATLLGLIFLIKAWRDLRSNSDWMEERYGCGAQTGGAHAEGWRRYLTTMQWVLSPRGRREEAQVGNLWTLYREAGSGRHRLPRILLLVTVYAVSLGLLWKVMGTEDFSGPCRGTFSCRLDLVLVLASYVCAAVLNLFVFDAVLLCRRWIGSLTQATEGWPEALTGRLKLQSAEHVAKARELMKIELIAKRTDVVNRLVRYPFIVLLIMMVARNSYFDNWHFPLTMVVGWAVNVLLAMAAALLLYRAAEQARNASVSRLNQLVLQGLDRGTAGEPDVKLTRQVIEDIEAVSQGAFVPLWQQPVVESSFYGGLAVVQYLYLN
ncbi:MAG: hypothetical protein RI101_09790 [Nitrospira sp.]|jgi:hypothetical protein|nr:hypothetical protein [Nitrospira sp.]